ncbi:DEAD/DEAH box helicase [Desulfolutivibrio sulfoxidireducens]|uniref:DEAD/DEAH box helicase n=1 Tax=Desulfolutivibrio sulfoxidireducens TaxID=2773299 RepID=UPI00159DCFD2|nr:DEAD/DEAH box helicase [Desulfolutivibrio sulfoxidireducens]QLA15985.1 DEAD/DEAH box helicase [Desulfolutivibrio sulfoxidireducens]
MSSLHHFDPLVASWFRERLGEPTEVQEKTWVRVARGEHVLVTAETGSGKTLAAFLHVINGLLTGAIPTGGLRALYVSPLKALGADVRDNLAVPLGELRRRFLAAGREVPDVRVMTRSGDTTPDERRRMLRRPPEILVTTPESLHLLLTSKGGRSLLVGVRVVIVDEIHAMAASRRGTLASVCLERLAHLCGEFQRVALSATVRPVDIVARFVGGYRLTGEGGQPVHEARPVAVVQGRAAKQSEIVVRIPERTGERMPGDFFDPYVAAWREILAKNRTTAFFIDSRRLCEKVARLVNAGADPPVVYPHHGSLSREVRLAVERRLKSGGLRGVVATGSLELGIDVGELDETVLIQTPPSISAAVQRVGRSGHRVGGVRRGTFFPLSDLEAALAGVMARAVADGDIEPVRLVTRPLDVLAQALVSMTAHEAVAVDALFDQARCSPAYHDLSRRQFDLVVDMLAGRYGQARPRELSAKVFFDRVAGTLRARPGAVLSLYASGGVIPDRGTYTARVAGGGADSPGAVVAELDEEFVFEARLGQVFSVGGQGWRIERITPAEVVVSPAPADAGPPPFWHGDQRGFDDHFAARVGEFFAWAEDRLSGTGSLADAAFVAALTREYHLEPRAAEVLGRALARQREATGAPLPHGRHILVEHTATGPGGVPGRQIILHMPFGLRVNRTMALVLEAALGARFSEEVRTHAANEGVALICPDDMDAASLLLLVTPGEVESLVRGRLEGSKEFGAAFREAAWRSLVLGRTRIGRRMPLWITRLRSQKLLAAVRNLEDFPLLIEAWRTCLTEHFDVPGLVRVLEGLRSGGIAFSETRTVLQSPLARDMVWRVVAGFMYAGDQSMEPATTRLSPDLVAEAAADQGLRPVVREGTAVRFGCLVRRTAPGYAPGSAEELLRHVIERLAVPLAEWEELGAAMARDHGLVPADLEEALSGRLARYTPPFRAGDAAGTLVAAVENLPRLEAALYPGLVGQGMPAPGGGVADSVRSGPPPPFDTEDFSDPDEIALEVVSQWLRFYGPVDPDFPALTLGIDPGRGRLLVDALVRNGTLVVGRLMEGGGREDVCDTANFESLLRLGRSLAVPRVETVPLSCLVPFVAVCQGVIPKGRDPRDLFERAKRLTCLSLPAGLWEAEVFPARMAGYDPAMLDTAMRHTGLGWRGRGERRVCFVFPGDVDLLAGEDRGGGGPQSDGLAALFCDPRAAYDFSTLLGRSGPRPGELIEALWAGVWRGEVENSDFEVLRHGLGSDFSLPSLGGPGTGPGGSLPGWPAGKTAYPRPGRTRVSRGRQAFWRAALPRAGVWRLSPRPEPSGDRLELDERARERARLLLDRYGVVFREVLGREEGPFAWGAVFRALRLLELAGEAMSGRFFADVPGPQFISPRGLAVFRREFPGREGAGGKGGRVLGRAAYWLCALDPAAPILSGLALPGEGSPGRPPRRAEGTHLVFRGTGLVLVSEGRGRELFIGPGPDDPDPAALFSPLAHLLTRRGGSAGRLAVARINGLPAMESPYRATMGKVFEVTADHKGLSLHPRRS